MPEISDAELAELRAAKESKDKLEAKNKELLTEKQKEKERADAAEAQRLKEAGDYKTLAEKLEAEAKAEKEKNAKLEADRIADLKKGALSTELDKLGILPERKAFIMAHTNLDAVTYNEAAKMVLGAEIKAKEIQTQMPEIFGKPNNNLPGQGGGNGGNNNNGNSGAPAHMTQEWFNSLSEADKDKHRSEFLKSQGVTMRSGASR